VPTNPADAIESGLLPGSVPPKPKLRGWLHAVSAPLALVAGIVLTVLSHGPARWAVAIYTVTAVLLFGVSGLYHRGHWTGRGVAILRRLDHANIFLIIAGSYTPFAVVLMPGGQGRVLLWLVWSGALAGVAFRVIWVGAPRWLYTPVYVALGWVSVFYLPTILHAGGVAVLVLTAAGGLLYTAGGVIYGLKRPNISPRWFGFHELFHSFVLGGFITQYIAISIAVYTHG
jgi:hemolysin III